MNDPYSTLGVSPNASMDEIKAAYRKLALKYHPDRNGGSKEAEAKMKEINDAYAQVTNMKKGGSASGYGAQGGYQSSQGGYQQGYQGGYRNASQGGYDPFGGFDPFGFGGFGGYQQRQQTYSSPEMQAARNYVRFGHYQEAQNLLRNVANRTAEWYFVSAQVEYGLGNKASALDHAQRACQMDPDNFEFRRFLSQLESGSQAYRSAGQGYGFGTLPMLLCRNPFFACCMMDIFCSCCCGGHYYGC